MASTDAATTRPRSSKKTRTPEIPLADKALLTTDELAALLKNVLTDPARLQSLREHALERMKTWTPSASADALVDAVERAVTRSRGEVQVATVSSEKYTSIRLSACGLRSV